MHTAPKMDATYQSNEYWEKLATRIVAPQQVVIVMGATDVGKSTFCRFLVDAAVGRGLKAAWVDTDVGQSHIGPPTTIGMKSFEPQPSPVQFNGGAEQLYFVGDLSPRSHTVEMLTGARLLVDRARETGADFIVVDTTGYLHEATAISLKQQKLELIRPDHLVCIGRSNELERIAAPYREQDWVRIHVLRPHRKVRRRNSTVRREYRTAQFDAYFSPKGPDSQTEIMESSVQHLPFEQVRGGRVPFFIGRRATEKELETLSGLAVAEVCYAEWQHRTLCLIASKPLSKSVIAHIKNYLSLGNITAELRSYFDRRLVGLIDVAGNTIGIGIVEKVDFQEQVFNIRCKVGAAQQTCAIQFGSYRLPA